MFRIPQRGNSDDHLSNENWEFSQSYLTRTRRMLFLRGPIAEERVDIFSPACVGDDVLAFNVYDPARPVMLLINSGGGEVPAGFQLFDILKASRAPIYTVAASVASMATVILMAGEKRLAFPHAQLMLHLPSADFGSQDSKTSEIRAKLLQKTRDDLIDVYLDRGVTAGLAPGTDRARIRKQILKDVDREYWLDAEEAIRYGLIDAIVTPEDLFGEHGSEDQSLIEVPRGY